MSLTLDREINDAAVTLREMRGPFPFQDQTGYGIVQFHGLAIAPGTEKQPPTKYYCASRPSPSRLEPEQDQWPGLPAVVLYREWVYAQVARDWQGFRKGNLEAFLPTAATATIAEAVILPDISATEADVRLEPTDDTVDWLATQPNYLLAFQGQWVALVNREVIAHDASFLELMKQVETLDIEDPLLVPVPTSEPFIG